MARECSDEIRKSMETAVRQGNTKKVRSLIETYGLSYSEDWKDGYSLLCDALRFSQKDIAKVLLLNDCKVNPVKPGGSCTPLHMAVRLGDEDIVRSLLEKGANINATFGEKKQSVLHEAVIYNKVDMIKLLLGYGADYDLKDRLNKSPVDVAAQSGSVLLLKYAHGDDSNALVQCLQRNTW